MEMMELVSPMTMEQLQRLRRQVALLPGSPNADAMQACLRAINESLFTKELSMDELHVLVPFARVIPDQLLELDNLIEQNLLNRASETVRILNEIFYQIFIQIPNPSDRDSAAIDALTVSLLQPAADDLEGRYVRNKLLYQYPAAAARRLAKFEIQQGLDQYLPVRAAMESAAQTIDGWDDDLTAKQDRVDKLQSLITKQHGELNFVGLSKAFQRLARAKSGERSLHGILAILIAVSMAAVIAGVAHLSKTGYQTHIVISGLSAEVLLAYLLRVSLGNYSSAKAQLLQFAHRRELCAFIEGYAEFVMSLRDKAGQETLQKFEAIIFSGVTPNPEKIPSQFDGLEGLAKLVSELSSAVKR